MASKPVKVAARLLLIALPLAVGGRVGFAAVGDIVDPATGWYEFEATRTVSLIALFAGGLLAVLAAAIAIVGLLWKAATE